MRNLNTFRDGLTLCIAAAAFLHDAAYAIDPNRAMSQYVRDHWGPEQGFPRGPVYAISQTSDGYLWIGTDTGLVRFDGLNFRQEKGIRPGFSTGPVLGLIPDPDGSLWVRLRRPTLMRYRNGEFENVMSSMGRPHSTVATMSRAQNGALLLWVLEGEGSAIVRNGNGFDTIATTSSLSRSPVLSIAQAQDGDIWAGTRDAGLFRVSGGHTVAIANGLPDLKVNCLLPAENGELWAGTDRGIARWNGTELTQSGIPQALSKVRALAMLRDRDSNIWIGTNSEGLLRLNARGVSSFDSSERMSTEAVTALFEDREGNLWIGGANGLERLRDSAFVTYSPSQGLPTDGNVPVFVDSENRTWFAPTSGGLWWLREGQHGLVSASGLGNDVVYSIAGRGGDLWLGRQRGGLTRLRSERGSFQTQTYTQTDGLAQNSVYSVHVARDGTVWAGTLSGGASKFANTRFTTYTSADGLASNTVASILDTSDTTTWFATPGGLSALSNGRWRTYTTDDGLASANVNCLLEDSGGVLWIGTSAGVAFLRDGRIQTVTGAAAFLKERILGIAEDRIGSLWIATSSRVLRAPREKLLSRRLSDTDVREYGLADGLHGTEGVKRHRSVHADSLGRIWFSPNRGLSVVDPSRLTRASAPAIVHIQTLAADGTEIALRDPVRVPAGRQRITLGYAGLSLAVPERVRFRYMLDGFDRAWSEPTSAREAVYTNLNPGPYRFRVAASNAEGEWNGSEAAIGFEIEPTLWQSSWFRLSVLAAAAMAIAGLYRLRLNQLTRRLNVRFEERLAERTRIAQELHDTLLQGFLSASMQLHVAADRLPSDSPVKPALTRVLQLMRQVIDEGRNVVRGLRSSRNGALDLEHAFSRIQEELAVDEPTDFRVVVEGKPQPLHPVLRDEVYRIGREALVNAIRHSRARKIEVELEYTARLFRCLVRDDGCGIDPEIIQSGREGHWGLPGMRERAERIGARLQVWSSAAAGTEVVLSIPGHVAFQRGSAKGLRGLLSRLLVKGTIQKENER